MTPRVRTMGRSVSRLRTLLDRTRAAIWLRKCKSVGEGYQLEGRPTLMCWPNVSIRIGARFRLSSVPEPSHIVAGAGAEILIGDDVWIGHGASISANYRVSIGDGTKIGPFVTIMDTDFHVAGDRSAVPAATPIAIGRDVYIGNGTTILRGTSIGDAARLEPCSVVSGAVPPGSTFAGVPARDRRASSSDGTESVSDVLVRTFNLVGPPRGEDGPRDIPGWDSLGALKLLLALEDAFCITLEEDDLLRVCSVRDVAELVDRARERSPLA
jgi:acetyltransferase-like isoleucine patch superfamily enzyme/acyl carrier protein